MQNVPPYIALFLCRARPRALKRVAYSPLVAVDVALAVGEVRVPSSQISGLTNHKMRKRATTLDWAAPNRNHRGSGKANRTDYCCFWF